MYFFVGREGFPMTQPSREGIFAASDLATRGKDNGTPERRREITLSAPMFFLSPPIHALATQVTLAYSL